MAKLKKLLSNAMVFVPLVALCFVAAFVSIKQVVVRWWTCDERWVHCTEL